MDLTEGVVLGGEPFDVSIAATGGGLSSPARAVRLSGPDRESGTTRRREYFLADAGHPSYLDLFESVARDFGTRVPAARRPAESRPAGRVAYRPLLVENLSPDVHFGYGDPAVLRVEAGAAGEAEAWYYLVVTSNDAPHSFPILRSRDLSAWELRGFVLPRGAKPAWAAEGEHVADYWAPEMHRVGDEFRVYFVARDRHSRELSIGVASSARPDGPYVAAPAPVLRGGVIDPHVHIGNAGEAWLFWKEDTNDVWPALLGELLLASHRHLVDELFPREEDRLTALLARALWPWARTLEPMERFFVQQPLIEAVTSDFGAFGDRLSKLPAAERGAATRDQVSALLRAMKTPVYAQRLSPDGGGLVGERRRVLENDREWEAHIVEGVWVSAHGGRYYMFYAGNDFSTAQYGIGVAVADSPLGPYRKASEPLLRSTEDWRGPGHPSVALGPDGAPWLFLHAYAPGGMGYKVFRALLALPIAFEPDGVVIRDSSFVIRRS